MLLSSLLFPQPPRYPPFTRPTDNHSYPSPRRPIPKTCPLSLPTPYPTHTSPPPSFPFLLLSPPYSYSPFPPSSLLPILRPPPPSPTHIPSSHPYPLGMTFAHALRGIAASPIWLCNFPPWYCNSAAPHPADILAIAREKSMDIGHVRGYGEIILHVHEKKVYRRLSCIKIYRMYTIMR